MSYCDDLQGFGVIPWRAGTTRFRSDWSDIWFYNPRMESLRHGVEEPGDVEDIRLVVDTIPTLAWSAGPDGSAEFFNQRWLSVDDDATRRPHTKQ
jgi:hypothetical protein